MLLVAFAALSLHAGVGCVDAITAADTIDLGDHFEPADVILDADYYHCVIEPEVVTKYACAAGAAGDGDGCHASRSALRLLVVDTPTRCSEGRVIGSPAPASVTNFERSRISVGIDADSSPFYRRPLGLDSHPRAIFEAGSVPAEQIRTWIEQGTP